MLILHIAKIGGNMADAYTYALESGWEARWIAGEELGETEDVSDFIRDKLHDEGFSHDVIDRVVTDISKSEGWDHV
jgi:hypothetical protein